MPVGDFEQYPNFGKRSTAELDIVKNSVLWSGPLYEKMKEDIDRQINMASENIENLKRAELNLYRQFFPGIKDSEFELFRSDRITSVSPRSAMSQPASEGLVSDDGDLTIEINKLKNERVMMFKELQKISELIKRGWDRIDRLNRLLEKGIEIEV